MLVCCLEEFGSLLVRRICYQKCGGRSAEQINFLQSFACVILSVCFRWSDDYCLTISDCVCCVTWVCTWVGEFLG